MNLSKKELRKKIKAIFNEKSPEKLEISSKIVLQKLEENPKFKIAKTIALFHSLPDEVTTHDFIDKWSESKNILLPKIIGEDIVFYTYIKGSIKQGKYSIFEPTTQEELSSEIDLIIVPGVAFDLNGARLGRGKGYYDRFFALYPSVASIGICHDFQLVEKVPTESHDKMVDLVIY